MYKEKGVWAGTTEEERKNLDPWIGEQLREIAKSKGMLESRNVADFLPPVTIILSLTVDQEVEDLVQWEAPQAVLFLLSDESTVLLAS